MRQGPDSEGNFGTKVIEAMIKEEEGWPQDRTPVNGFPIPAEPSPVAEPVNNRVSRDASHTALGLGRRIFEEPTNFVIGLSVSVVPSTTALATLAAIVDLGSI